MTKEEFIALFKEEVEIEEEMNEFTELTTIEEWDSMAAMVVVSIADEHFNVKLSAEEIGKLNKMTDLIEAIGVEKFD